MPALPFGFTVMTMLDGTPLSEVCPQLTDRDLHHVYQHIGRLMAQVHRIGQDDYGYLTTRILDPQPTNTGYMLGQFTKKLREFADLGGAEALSAAIEAHVREHSHLFAACSTPVLCHNDLHEGNVLVSHHGDGWQVTGYVDVENAIAADPLLDLAKTDYYAIRGDQTKRGALLRGYGALPKGWFARLAIYRLYHALELWDWFALINQPAPLPGIAADIARIVNARA